MLILSLISLLLGSASIDLFPSALGPISDLPLIHIIILFSKSDAILSIETFLISLIFSLYFSLIEAIPPWYSP